MSESGMPQLNTEYFASQIFWLVISFIILYVVMSKYALPKIANVIETREDIIARDVEEAENFKKESEITEQGYLQSIKEAQENASNYLSNSRNKLNIFIEEENSVFENESRDLINKFERHYLNVLHHQLLSELNSYSHQLSFSGLLFFL